MMNRITRRALLFAPIGVAAASGFSARVAAADDPWPSQGVIHPWNGNGVEPSAVGCMLSVQQEASFRPALAPTSGNQFVDRGFGIAQQLLNETMSVSPEFGFFADPSPNAFAMPGGNGTVCFGYRLMSAEMAAAPSTWGTSLYLIMAHEWTHITQFANDLQGSTSQKELHADFLAGWTIGLFNRKTRGYGVDPYAAARSIFSKGDFAFNNPSHHGTPNERLSAVSAGYKLSFAKGESDFDTAYQAGCEFVSL